MFNSAWRKLIVLGGPSKCSNPQSITVKNAKTRVEGMNDFLFVCDFVLLTLDFRNTAFALLITSRSLHQAEQKSLEHICVWSTAFKMSSS